jgi:hypothetical protein
LGFFDFDMVLTFLIKILSRNSNCRLNTISFRRKPNLRKVLRSCSLLINNWIILRRSKFTIVFTPVHDCLILQFSAELLMQTLIVDFVFT